MSIVPVKKYNIILPHYKGKNCWSQAISLQRGFTVHRLMNYLNALLKQKYLLPINKNLQGLMLSMTLKKKHYKINLNVIVPQNI